MAKFLDIFAQESPEYAARKAAWLRDERRHYGQDAVLPELASWKGEEPGTSGSFYQTRQGWASYLNFGHIHATTLTGHLARKAPPLNYGSLGEVRSRDQVDTPSMAELFDYNANGTGNDGTQFRAFMDGVQERAGVTGHRYLMVEMPSLATIQAIRAAAGRPVGGPGLSAQDQIDGAHPYLVERSPLSAPNGRTSQGVRNWIVFRELFDPKLDTDTKVNLPGYYVLVRTGYTGLGDEYEEGGWWKFDADQRLLDDGHEVWSDTRGQIPVVPLISESSSGTTVLPATSRSLTMELNQIAVGHMNLSSARDFNLYQAGKSTNYILGGDKDTHSTVRRQQEDGSITVTVPPVMYEDGKVGIPQIWNSAEAAITSGAFKEVLDGKIAEAKEIMVRQVTSTPESSGVSKEAGFAEATSPLLARLAANRETCENSLLYFVALRFGKEPDASVVWPREFPIRDLLTDIDSMLDTMRRTSLSSPTLERDLIVRKADQLGLMPEDQADRDVVEKELEDAAAKKVERAAQADALFNGLGNIPSGSDTGNGGAPSNRIAEAEAAA